MSLFRDVACENRKISDKPCYAVICFIYTFHKFICLQNCKKNKKSNVKIHIGEVSDVLQYLHKRNEFFAEMK